MAEAGRLTLTARKPARLMLNPVTALRIAIIVVVLAPWEALAASGLLYRDVVPSLVAIAKALWTLLADPDMPVTVPWSETKLTIPQIYWHLYTTFYEIAVAMLIGDVSGLAAG